MKLYMKKQGFLRNVLAFALVFVLCNMNPSLAADLKPIQEINLCTWTKTQAPIQYEEAFPIAENWKKLGMKVRVEPVNFPNPLLERTFKTHDFDVFIIEFIARVERLDPDFYTYNSFHSSNAASGWNQGGFVNKDFDRLAEAQREEYDLQKRKALVDQCQEFLYRENPWIVMVNPHVFQAYNEVNFKDPVVPKVGGFEDPFAYMTIKPVGERKVIRWGVFWSDLKTSNPFVISESTQVIMITLIYDMLMRIGPDGKPQLWAAEAINPIDEKTIDVTIRKDLKFHDGKPLTAEDVKFTFDHMIKYQALYYKTALNALETTEVLDRYKVRFHLKIPHAPFISQTLAMVPLLPKHIWERIEKPTEYPNVPPIGSGPFRFDHWKKAQELKMSRFPDHFRPAHVDGILVIFYGTREAAFTALVQKETDVAILLIPHQIEELKRYPYIKTIQLPSTGSDSMMINCRRKPFDDPKFRLALAHTIPRKQILEELYNGYGNMGGSIIAPANQYWNNPKIKPYPFDLDKAREILKQAGYRWDKDGRLCYPPE